MKLSKQIKRWGHKVTDWHRGAGKTLKFWDPKSVRKGVHQQWKQDPLGRQLNKLTALYSGKFNYGSSASSSYTYTPKTIAQLTTHR